MSTHTETELKSPKHRATAPVTPTSQKKPGFFKRHLARRRSSVSFPNGHPGAPHSHGHAPPSPTAQKSAPRKASVTSSTHEIEKPVSNGTDSKASTEESKEARESVEVPHSPPQSPGETPRSDSKSSGIKWAEGFADGPPANRPRRASSAGTARRSSIYQKTVAGDYTEGVDHGVGSKARRLSVQIPDRMDVDECPLSEHFSLMSRAGKKDIGEGGAAVVRLMQSKTAGSGNTKLVAVKEFREWDKQEEDESDYIRKIKSEYAIAKSCVHPNIVETYRLCHSDKKWFHVMEYCDLGDLNDIINKGYFNREDRNCMFKQLLRGVEFLHSRGIAHRDLKSENLLLTTSGCLKIADFCTAEVFSGTHPGLRNCRRQSLIDEEAQIRYCKPGMVGSKPYMAPEIIEHKDDYDPRAVDVWSCAIVYLSLCCGGTPWEAASPKVNNFNIYLRTWDDWLDHFKDGELTDDRPLPKFASTKQFAALDDMATKRIVLGMLHPDPDKRWTAHDALDTVTVTEYSCCQQEGYSDDIKTRQRKALHNHVPPKSAKGSKFMKPGVAHK